MDEPCHPVIAVLGGEAGGFERDEAAALAARLDVPIVESAGDGAAELLLAIHRGRLEVRPSDARPGSGLSVDFTSLARRRDPGHLTRRQPLLKAIGRGASRVLDATAGAGQDAFLLARFGLDVTAVERSPILHALLDDGIRRAREDPQLHALIDDRLTCVCGDAREYLRTLESPPGVVYVDPMFPPRRKTSALPKKKIILMRRLVGDDPDAGALVEVAQRVARRVVVKRPHEAPPLAADVSMSYPGKLVRYDVYLGRGDQ